MYNLRKRSGVTYGKRNYSFCYRKGAKDLSEQEKTLYYERMAFVIEIPEISEVINGNKLSLAIGGVRAYNQENLYGKRKVQGIHRLPE
jgi:hypothetical protein